MNTTGEGLLVSPGRPPGCRFPTSMGFSCRLSMLLESGACVPKAALRSRSVRRPVLRDLQGEGRGQLSHLAGRRAMLSKAGLTQCLLPRQAHTASTVTPQTDKWTEAR